MFESNENMLSSKEIDRIKEAYRDHPCMHRVNVFKQQLKQEKIQDRVFCQSLRQRERSLLFSEF